MRPSEKNHEVLSLNSFSMEFWASFYFLKGIKVCALSVTNKTMLKKKSKCISKTVYVF